MHTGYIFVGRSDGQISFALVLFEFIYLRETVYNWGLANWH